MSHESHTPQTTAWVTPRWVFDWLGRFDLDPATFENHPWPCAAENRVIDGLSTPWHGRVFLNPPFTNGQIEPFVERMALHGNGVLIVAARVETGWFQDYVFGAAQAVWFPRKRVQFCNQSGQPITRCGFPSCVAFYEKPPVATPRPGTWWRRDSAGAA
jgi:hypothetical protein